MRQKELYIAITLSMALLLIGTAAVLASAGRSEPPTPDIGTHDLEATRQLPQAHPLLQATANAPAVFIRAAEPGVDSLDPHWQYDATSSEVIQQVYEPLIFYDREAVDEYIPMLADALPEISPDHTLYTFTVREGVEFHQGGSLTASDVAYSFWRWMLQDRDNGPSWIILEAMLGKYDIDDVPGTDSQKCQTVKNSVTFDNENRTVTFHLTRPFNPLLDVLVSPLASILDQEWMATNGGWGGDCADWRSYHDPGREDSILWNQMNGTGPFQFQSWTGSELTLVRNNAYWRKEPIWDGGPNGIARLLGVVFRYEDDAATRLDLMDTGQVDSADVASEYITAANALVRDEYDGGEMDPDELTVLNGDGTLRSFRNLPSLTSGDAIFIFDIAGDSTYIGSGALDGAGIPTNFFTDTHVRKAFNYCFDWDEYIAGAYNGEAEQRRGPIPRGVMGYTTTQEVFTHSLALCESEFQQAWGGQLWSNGFSMTIAYNTGNTWRQAAAEIIKENVESITDTFHITVIDMAWPDFRDDLNASKLPIALGGWIADYNHPHNWVHPYMNSAGVHGSKQGFPEDMQVEFDDKIEECLTLIGQQAQECYRDLQDMAYDNVIDIFMAQPVHRHYERLGVTSYYHNPVYPGPYYYYAIWEGPRSFLPLTMQRYQ